MSSCLHSNRVIGIDLGLSHSVIASFGGGGSPQTLLSAEGESLIPSFLDFGGNEKVVVGKQALKTMSTSASQVADCALRDLGTRFYHKQLRGRRFPPEALLAWILSKLRIDGEERVGAFTDVALSVPAYFDEFRRSCINDSAFMAGLDVKGMITGATAAALAFGFQHGFMNRANQDDERRNVVVYDLGGGTFDVVVMGIGSGDFTTLATDGEVMLGGRDWDERLVQHVATEFARRFGIDPRDDPNADGRLWCECEDAKRSLTARTKASIACEYQGNAIRVTVTRRQFEDMTRDLLDRTAFTTNQTLQAAGLDWKDIDRVLLVGGSSRMPAVSEMLRQLSGKEPDCSMSPDEAVAHGTAIYSHLLRMQREQGTSPFRLTLVTPHSTGVAIVHSQTRRPRNTIVIPRNTPMPATFHRRFNVSEVFFESNQLQILEGESFSPGDCSKLISCLIPEPIRGLPADSTVEVGLRYEQTGRLTVTISSEDADDRYSFDFAYKSQFTQEQLESWRTYVCGHETSFLHRTAQSERSTCVAMPRMEEGRPLSPSTLTARDAYRDWLGIPEDRIPPDHYTLLGLPYFESNPDEIYRATLARTKIVRPRCLKYHEVGTLLLNAIASASVCLRDIEAKAAYDATIRFSAQ